MTARFRTVGAVFVLVVLGLLLLWGGTGTDEGADPAPTTRASAPGGPATATRSAPSPTVGDPESGLPLVPLDALPAEAQRTVTLIDRGGPFRYAKDGVTFGNREGLLPAQRPGYYREYTVETPGEGDRGARRIVTGDDGRQLFWTDDHYDSFARVAR